MNEFTDVLKWIAAGGSIVIVSWFVSWVLEGFAWWNNLTSGVKSMSILAVAIVIGLAAQYVLSLPSDVLTKIAPYATIVFGTIGAWLSTQVAHRSDKKYRDTMLL